MINRTLLNIIRRDYFLCRLFTVAFFNSSRVSTSVIPTRVCIRKPSLASANEVMKLLFPINHVNMRRTNESGVEDQNLGEIYCILT